MDNYFLVMFLMSISFGVMAGVIGYVYAVILTKPDMILAKWKLFLFNTYDRITGIETPLNYKFRWVLKPLVECEACVAGQIAFWTFVCLVPFISNYFLFLAFTVCLAILITQIPNQTK